MEKTPISSIFSPSVEDTCTLQQELPGITNSELKFLPNPQLDSLKYCDRKIALKANLYKIKIKKSYTLYEYSVKFQHEDPNLSSAFKAKILSKQFAELNKIYDVFFLTGDTLFSNTQIADVKNVLSAYKKFEYSILICPTKEKIELKDIEADIKTRPALKMILELIVKDVLKSNPKVKFMKNMYTMKNDKKPVKSYDNSISLFPGFSTKVLVLEQGIYLNVDIRNKISSAWNCMEIIGSFINNVSKITQKEKDQVCKYFKDRTVELNTTGQKFRIESVNFERNPKTSSVNFEGSNIALSKYYKNVYNIDLEPTQPLLLVQQKSGSSENRRYIPPELCVMIGLTDEMTQDTELMKNISQYTKMTPDDKVHSIDDILKLVNEKQGNVKLDRKTNELVTFKSSFEKMQEYGIEIANTTENTFSGYSMVHPQIKCSNNSNFKYFNIRNCK